MDRIIEKKKGLKKKHILIIAATIIFGLLLYYIISEYGVSSVKIDKNTIITTEVKQGKFNDYINISGQVEPIATIYLDAEEGGRVQEVVIEEGNMVKKGDVIIKLKNSNLHQEIMNSESNLAQKENMLRQTRINFENQRIESQRNLLKSQFDIQKKKRRYLQYKALFDDKLIAKEQYLEAKENYEFSDKMLVINKRKSKNDSVIMISEIKQLNSDLGKMRKTLDLVYERLDNLNVKAPVDGQLGMLDAQIGQSIGRGTRIGQINVLTNYKVEAFIDEHYIDRIKRGLSATVERNSEKYHMKIRKVYPEVRKGLFKVDLVFSGNKPKQIRTGQTYQINLQLGESASAVLIQRGNFFENTGGQWIYVLDETGKYAYKRFIKLGKQNPKYYEVINGLEPGERVVITGYEFFGENNKLILK